MQPKVLELRNVSVVRDGKKILSSIDLDIFKGENVAIIGPNGSGKTTLLQLFCGNIYPYYDEDNPAVLRILGQERRDLFEFRKHVGIVSMDLQNLFDRDTTVYEVICSGLFNSIDVFADRKVTEDLDIKVRSSATMMGIEDILDRKVSVISLGEMRRALISRALVNEPEMLILDEPMTGLDISMRSKFRRMFDILSSQGIGLILITHDLSEIPESVNHIIALKEGRILAEGTKKDVLVDSIMSDLYGESIKVIEDNGSYQMLSVGGQ